MEKKNENDALTADFLTILKMERRDEDCLANKYGLWESLSVDMLSPSELRDFAEHLDVCEECRKKCAELYEMERDEESPFNDRMREFQENPDAETDLNWRRIAYVFNPSLAGEVEDVEQDESVQGERESDENVPTPMRNFTKISPRMIVNVACAASAACLTFGLAYWRADHNGPAKPVASTEVPGYKNENASSRNFEEWTLDGNNVPGNTKETPTSKGLLEGINVPANSNENPFKDAVEASDWLRSLESNTETAESKTLSGGSAKGGLLNAVPVFEFESVDAIDKKYGWEEIAEADSAYREGRFEEAASAFGDVVKRLEAAESVDAKALIVARWNAALANAKAGDKKDAVAILKELTKMKELTGEKRAEVDAAIAEWQK